MTTTSITKDLIYPSEIDSDEKALRKITTYYSCVFFFSNACQLRVQSSVPWRQPRFDTINFVHAWHHWFESNVTWSHSRKTKQNKPKQKHCFTSTNAPRFTDLPFLSRCEENIIYKWTALLVLTISYCKNLYQQYRSITRSFFQILN